MPDEASRWMNRGQAAASVGGRYRMSQPLELTGTAYEEEEDVVVQ